MDDQITNGANQLLQYGALGVFCLFLIGCIWVFWNYMQRRDKEFLRRTDKFTEIMSTFASNEAAQTEVLRGLKEVIQGLNSKS